MHRDMDETIQGWPYEPQPGEVLAREIRARDGRMVIQIRVELGVLQLEVVGRPDGTRPHGFATYPRLPPPPCRGPRSDAGRQGALVDDGPRALPRGRP